MCTQSQSGIMSWQYMPTQFIVCTPDLEQSGQHNTIQAHPKTDISLWATLLNTLMRQADTAAYRGRVVGVTARYHNFILPLPAQLLTVIVTESDAQTLQANKNTRHMHTQTQRTKTHRNEFKVVPLLLDVTHCQVAGWVLSIELTEISILATKKKRWPWLSLNLSQAAWRSAHCWGQFTEFRVGMYVIWIHWFARADTKTRSLCQYTNVSAF